MASPSSSADRDEPPETRRLRRLALHLLGPAARPRPALLAAAPAAPAEVSAAALAARLRGRHRETQARVFEFFRTRPDLHTPVELPTAAHRDLCSRQLRALVREAGVRPLTLMALRPAEYFAVMEAAGGVDISLGVQLGVQYR
jgi:acyl-CoA oxidase